METRNLVPKELRHLLLTKHDECVRWPHTKNTPRIDVAALGYQASVPRLLLSELHDLAYEGNDWKTIRLCNDRTCVNPRHYEPRGVKVHFGIGEIAEPKPDRDCPECTELRRRLALVTEMISRLSEFLGDQNAV
jgi:hypothetical protein